MKSAWTTLRTALLWAMLPLTAFSGSPRYICLCSTGGLKQFCRGAASESSCPVDMAGTAALRAGRPSAHHSCCQRRASADSQTTCGTAECRCTPVVALPDTPPKAEPASAPTVDLATHEIRDDSFVAMRSSQSLAAGLENSPPEVSLDLLAMLSRLVI
jgi:hypothetical protein